MKNSGEKLKNTRIICSILFAAVLILNIIWVAVDSNSKISTSSAIGTVGITVSLCFGIYCILNKDTGFLFLIGARRFKTRYYWNKNMKTDKFNLKFTLCQFIYFIFIPFYLPVIFLAKEWDAFIYSVAIFSAPQVIYIVIIAFEIVRNTYINRRNLKTKEDLLEKERIEQERREELGKWQ